MQRSDPETESISTQNEQGSLLYHSGDGTLHVRGLGTIQSQTKMEFQASVPIKFSDKVPKSLQNRCKSCSSPHRVHRAASMVVRGGPEVPRWFPRVLVWCQNNPPGCEHGCAKFPKWQPRGLKEGRRPRPCAQGMQKTIEPRIGIHKKQFLKNIFWNTLHPLQTPENTQKNAYSNWWWPIC